MPRGVPGAVASSPRVKVRARSVSFPLAPSRRGGSDGRDATAVVHVDDDGGDRPGAPLLDPNFSRTHRTTIIGDVRRAMLLCTSSSSSSLTPTPRPYQKKEGTDTVIDDRSPRRSRGNSLFVSRGDFTCHRARSWYTRIEWSFNLFLSLSRVLFPTHVFFSIFSFLPVFLATLISRFLFQEPTSGAATVRRGHRSAVHCVSDHRAARPRLSSRRVATPCVADDGGLDVSQVI